MGFDYTRQELPPGKTVPFVLDMLPGKPVVHLEWLGETNKTWMSDQLARANAKKHAAKKIEKTLTEHDIVEMREKNRVYLAKHSVRDLEAIHTDTKKAATKDDIPLFMKSIPWDVVDLIVEFASNQENYREHDEPLADPKDLAEK